MQGMGVPEIVNPIQIDMCTINIRPCRRTSILESSPFATNWTSMTVLFCAFHTKNQFETEMQIEIRPPRHHSFLLFSSQVHYHSRINYVLWDWHTKKDISLCATWKATFNYIAMSTREMKMWHTNTSQSNTETTASSCFASFSKRCNIYHICMPLKLKKVFLFHVG